FDVPDTWKKIISIVPGLVNPLSAHWYAVSPKGKVYVVAEHYAAGRDIEWHSKKIIEKCQCLNWPRGHDAKYTVLMDCAANAQGLAGDMSVAQAFSRCGFSVITRVNKSLFAGISKVKEYLKCNEGGARLQVFSCCVNMIREFESYRYGNDVPVKRNDHAMDELRYFLMWFVPSAQPEEKTAIQKDKERLARRIALENKRKLRSF
ncbi:MAG TPA: hypothetical protein PLZ84_06755, partial [Clostridia bacterium]|nr:hypothetical protein [Clostridia bacterium]